MNRVVACVDGAACTLAVCDCAAWAAMRLSLPLELLHALDWHPERAPLTDVGGSAGLQTQGSLLEELAALDVQREVLARRHGRELLDALASRAWDAGVAVVGSRQRPGGLLESMLDIEPDARLFVLGQRQDADRPLDHKVESAVRSLQRPLLVTTGEFPAPRHFTIAFDGSATGRRMVEAVAASPLLRGLTCTVVMAGEESAASAGQLEWARNALVAAGFGAQAHMLAGELEAVLPGYLKALSVDLLVLGAHGHSRVRHLTVGSTATTLLRTSPVPVLVVH